MPVGRLKLSNNNTGKNQHRNRPIIEDFPELPQLLRMHTNAGVMQQDMRETLIRKHNISIGLRSIQSIMKKYEIPTVRRSGLTMAQQGFEILKISEDDPLQRFGNRLIKEKLAKKGVHISRDNIMKFRKAHNPEATAARHPTTRKVHHHGLHSAGPNEKWCLDGHEKILRSMGIAVYGVNDKYSRLELGLWAVPNARLADVPPILYLRLMKSLGGMPVTTTGDKGSELGKLISLVTTMRHLYQPHLSEELIPAFKTTKSVYNITRERGWRPLWEKVLGNILFEYKAKKVKVGFHEGDYTHRGVASWLWAKIVQSRLDEVLLESRTHRVSKQAKSLLPTGGRRIDFYETPENWNGIDLLIKVPKEDIETYLQKYDKPELLQFGNDGMVKFCEDIYKEVGSPELSAKVGWKIFALMLNLPFPEGDEESQPEQASEEEDEIEED